MARRRSKVGGRIIEKWIYSDERNGIRAEVVVRMISGGTEFLAECESYELTARGEILAKLKEEIFGEIRNKAATVWKPVLLVIVSHRRTRLFEKKRKPDTPDTKSEGHVQLMIDWERYQIATAHDGKKINRKFSAYIKPWSGDQTKAHESFNHTQSGWPDQNGYRFRSSRDDSQIVAIIDDTPENRVALEEIADAIENLSERLSKLMKPKKIAHTLAAIARGGIQNVPLRRLTGPEPAIEAAPE